MKVLSSCILASYWISHLSTKWFLFITFIHLWVHLWYQLGTMGIWPYFWAIWRYNPSGTSVGNLAYQKLQIHQKFMPSQNWLRLIHHLFWGWWNKSHIHPLSVSDDFSQSASNRQRYQGFGFSTKTSYPSLEMI